MTQEARYTETVIANVTPEVKQRITEMSGQMGVSQAHIVRKLLDAGLADVRRALYLPRNSKAPSD